MNPMKSQVVMSEFFRIFDANKLNPGMTEVTALQNIVSWSNQNEIESAERSEFSELVTGRSMLYAPVNNPKTFCADMKHSSGRLMDFNKGMFDSFPSLVCTIQVQQLSALCSKVASSLPSIRGPLWDHTLVANR